jgi:hypothetical protein
MAVCVLRWTASEDDPVTMCGVHLELAPCPRNGDPAHEDPVHGLVTDAVSRAQVMAHWQRTTRRQRRLTIHRVSRPGRQHRYHPDGQCWCEPENLEPEEIE